MRVEVLDYDPEWANQFQNLKQKLASTIPEYCSIEHVGSTSVPGLCAKPIIDIDIICAKEHVHEVIQSLKEYNYIDMGVPGRHALRQNIQTVKHNLYVCEDGCLALRNHLTLRDVCRSNPTVRDAYASKKRALAMQDWKDVNEYCDAKDEITNWMLAQGGLKQDEIVELHQEQVRAKAERMDASSDVEPGQRAS